MRTEFLFNSGLPDEETQLAAYRRVLEWAGGKPVTIRTVDAGGDKPVPGFTVEETNPFLGLRGIRLSLAKPGHIPRPGARPAARRGIGNLKVMFPMISIAAEYDAARDDLRRGSRGARPAGAAARHHGRSSGRRNPSRPRSQTSRSSRSAPTT